MNKTDSVKNYIKEKINSGKWVRGSKIFSENQFIDYLGVSRGIVRLAIKELISENILESRQGSGTYVKNENRIKDRILILIREKDTLGDITESFKYIFNRLSEKCREADYTPINFIDNNILNAEEAFRDSLDSIAGVISVFAKNRDVEFFRSRYIPCVSTCQITASHIPSVLLDYTDFFLKLKDLIKRYNLSDIVVFSRKQNLNKISHTNKDSFFLYAIEQYFSSFSLHSIPKNNNNNINIKHIKTILSDLRRVPDAIIFLDDTLYRSIAPYFGEFDPIMSKTKIITHYSHLNINEETPYLPCKISFDLETMAEETVGLLQKLIRGITPDAHNIYIKSVIENEDILTKK